MGRLVTHDGNEIDINGKSPWWITAIYKLGVPVAICLFLVWFLVTQVNAKLEGLTAQVAAHQAATTLEQQQVQFYLRAICVNTATTDRDRVACVTGQQTQGPDR